MTNPSDRMQAAIRAYKATNDELEAAHEQWDPYLPISGVIDTHQPGIEAAYERIEAAIDAHNLAFAQFQAAWQALPD